MLDPQVWEELIGSELHQGNAEAHAPTWLIAGQKKKKEIASKAFSGLVLGVFILITIATRSLVMIAYGEQHCCYSAVTLFMAALVSTRQLSIALLRQHQSPHFQISGRSIAGSIYCS